MRMTSHVTMSRGYVNVHQGSPAAAVRRIVLRVGLGRDVTRPVTVTRTRSVTQLLGAAAVDRATPARTAPEGKRIEKIGRLEESREMREYQSCLLKTNPK